MTHAEPVPDPTARHSARYDTDPDALAWARAKVQHQLDRLAAFEARATETGKTELAHGLSMARRSTQQLLLGGERCVVAAFDERRPMMFAAATPAPSAPGEQLTAEPAACLQAAATYLRRLLADPQLTAGPWLSLDDGDRLLRNQPGDEDGAPIYVVNEPVSNGANAAWIAAMHPGVGEALVEWLETAAANAAALTWPNDFIARALAVADAILAGAGQ